MINCNGPICRKSQRPYNLHKPVLKVDCNLHEGRTIDSKQQAHSLGCSRLQMFVDWMFWVYLSGGGQGCQSIYLGALPILLLFFHIYPPPLKFLCRRILRLVFRKAILYSRLWVKDCVWRLELALNSCVFFAKYVSFWTIHLLICE